jgi:putative DNA primase/helicase
MPDIIDSVLDSLEFGLAIFPLGERDKRPVYGGGCRNAARSRPRVLSHWQQHPNHNYGIATGKLIFVVDIDGLPGETSWQALCAQHGPLPPTVTVITAKGRHLYFKTNGVLLGNSVGKLGPGIDVRGDGGYVVGAGSVHPSGHVYRYADGPEIGS